MNNIGVERTLRTEELARDVESLTSHDDDPLTTEQLLGNSAGQATKEVSLAVNDDLFQSHPSVSFCPHTYTYIHVDKNHSIKSF